MTHILFKGPTEGLYTHGKWYKVNQETNNGWFIVDDQGYTTNVSKVNNFLWEGGKDG